MLASDNYAWVYLRRENAWYILSRDAGRDQRTMTLTSRQPFYLVGEATVYFTSQHRTMTLNDSRGTHHLIICTRPSPAVNTPTRNYHSRACARDYIGGRRPGNEASFSARHSPRFRSPIMRDRADAEEVRMRINVASLVE